MATIVTRETGATAKNSPLTNAEVDNNFINLNNNKFEKSGDSAGYIDISMTPAVSTQAGRILWDDGNGTITIGLKGGNVTLQVGQEQVVRVYNGTGSTLTDGQVVYITGAQGNRVSVALASNGSEAGSSVTIGMVTETIANGAEGFVTTHGIVNGLNTSALSEGAALWLGATAGTYTTTKPTAPTHSVFLGYVVRSHASAGAIYVHVQNGHELDELHDVLITSKADNDLLQYDSASGLWKNTADPFDLVNYPSIKSTLNLDFANSKALDSRITFDRASIGSYIDEDGLIKLVASGQPRFDHDPVSGVCKGLLIEEQRTNLCPYSDTVYTTVNANRILKLYSGISPNGLYDASLHIPNSGATASWGAAAITGQSAGTYTISVYLKDFGAGQANLYFFTTEHSDNWKRFDLVNGTLIDSFGTVGAAGTHTITNVGNGWFRCTFTFTTTGMSNLQVGVRHSSWTGDGVKGYYLWGFQLEAGSFATSYIPSTETFTGRTSIGTYIGSDGLIKTAAAGEARYNYNPDNLGLAPKLLLEEQRGNLFTYSEQFDNIAWNKFIGTTSVTPNTTTAPDGTLTADTLNFPASGDRIDQFKSSSGVVNYTFSLWLAGSGTITMSLATLGGTYKIANNTITLTSKMTRYSVSITTNSDNTGIYPIIGRYSGSSNTATQVYAWGGQLEIGTYPTSYIPTTTTSVTRNADTSTSATTTRLSDKASIDGINFYSLYNQSEGSLVVKGISPLPSSGITNLLVSIGPNSTTYSDHYYIARSSTGYSVAPNSGNINLGINGTVNTENYSIALGIKNNDAAFVTMGGTVGTDTSCIFPTSLKLTIGKAGWADSNFLNGCISKLTYYPKRLSNTILQTLTK